MSYKAAIFDMDGTVLDTITDLGHAINYAMQQTGHRHDYTKEDTCVFFGSGVKVAVSRALGKENGLAPEALLRIGVNEEKDAETVDMAEVQRIIPVFKTYYERHCADMTRPYQGILDALEKLRRKGIKTAVVSNKPNEAVQKLVKVHFADKFDLSVGQQDEIRRKPYPDMTQWALRQLDTDPDDAVYIGDTEIDLLTAENTGMDCIAVDWGFRTEAYLRAHGADRVVSDAEQMLQQILK